MGKIMIKDLPVTVLLCTHKGWSQWVCDCVQSILTNDYESFELIVVDSSPDGFVKNLLENRFSTDNRLKCISIHNPETKKSLALNVGVQRAVGDLLIFTDDDVLVSPQWIRAYVEAHNELTSRNVKIGAMGGPVQGIWLAPKPSWWPQQWLYLTCEWDFGNSLREFRDDDLPFGANMAFPKEVFSSIGGFDESIGVAGAQRNLLRAAEDSLCVLRVKKIDRALYYVPGARVSHIMRPERLTKTYFLQRMMLEGFSRLAIKAKLASQSAEHQAENAIDAALHLAGTIVRDVVVPALKGKLNEQTLMSALGLVAMSYGAMRFVCGSYVRRFLGWTRLAPDNWNSG
jgi:glycosyltransferase involved in cell wall biosynthesis